MSPEQRTGPTTMLKSLSITNFRGIENGSLVDLTPLVVLVGPNGCGKSTVLEAALIAGSPEPVSSSFVAMTTGRPRPHDNLAYMFKWMFYRGDFQRPPAFEVVFHDLPGSYRISSKCEPNPGQTYPRIQFSPEADSESRPASRPPVKLIGPFGWQAKPLPGVYSSVVERGLKREAKELVLSLVRPAEDFELLADEQNKPVMHLIFRDYSIPVAVAGEGIHLLFYISFFLAAERGSTVLFEEPEAHLHPAAIHQCAKAICAAVARGTQVILSTHSLELIDSLISWLPEADLLKLSVYGLRLEAGQLKSSRLVGKEVVAAREVLKEDLR